MAYFPDQVMPKMLMKETSKEVDDNPAIYNAKNWNTHHREIRAIEEFLLGNKDPDSIIFAGKDLQGTIHLPSSVSTAIANVRNLLEELFNGCWLTQYSGTVRYKNYIKLPDCLIQTKTTGNVNNFDTTIAVESTQGFPQSGTITKINGLRTGEFCQYGSGSYAVGAGGVCSLGGKYLSYTDFAPLQHRTSQEIITYTSKTDNLFLGCTRGVNGSTAETITTEQAVILSGNASLCISQNFWAEKANASPHACEAYVSVTPDLYVNGGVLKRGTNQVINPIEDFLEASYTLTVVSDFEDVGSSTPVPPIKILDRFFRLDRAFFGSVDKYDYMATKLFGLVVAPSSWINSINQSTVSIDYTILGGHSHSAKSQLQLTPYSITSTSAKFKNAADMSGPIVLSFKNYRSYGSLIAADYELDVSVGKVKHHYYPHTKTINATVDLTSSDMVTAKTAFSFVGDHYHHNYLHWGYVGSPTQISYIIPNASISGWEKYLKI